MEMGQDLPPGALQSWRQVKLQVEVGLSGSQGQLLRQVRGGPAVPHSSPLASRAGLPGEFPKQRTPHSPGNLIGRLEALKGH